MLGSDKQLVGLAVLSRLDLDGHRIIRARPSHIDPCEGLRVIEKSGRLRLVHVFDTGLTQIRMDPVGTGVVPFAAVADTLRDIGYEGWSVLCVISPTPETDILESRLKLAQWGWEAAPE